MHLNLSWHYNALYQYTLARQSMRTQFAEYAVQPIAMHRPLALASGCLWSLVTATDEV